eukprot:SAG31_NODE_22684_length_520_cov_0.845606_1_plen_65_part_10
MRTQTRRIELQHTDLLIVASVRFKGPGDTQTVVFKGLSKLPQPPAWETTYVDPRIDGHRSTAQVC